LDIAEKRRPQDGRLKIKTGGKEMDFRVSVLPTIWGEKIVMRLLDKSNLQLDMTKLGMEPEDLAIFKECIYQPQGLLLITGPTGSGKTTTIYSALAELNQPDVNISIAEDPVEFNFFGINQVQMNPDIDLTFATALRSFLRQDPDIIMVGEIRDLETAEIAMKAASTGHLVVSTLHTNDAPQTISRLTEMGIAPFIVASTINLIVAQRLVRKICTFCKKEYKLEKTAADDLARLFATEKLVTLFKNNIPKDKGRNTDATTFFQGEGCRRCGDTGYKGRQGIYEVLEITPDIVTMVNKRASADEIALAARKNGMLTMLEDALLKAKMGITTISEILRVTKE
jgi:type IV pilus assembly protein PilB